MFKNPWVVFIGLSTILAIVFFVFPINLFDGVIIYKSGLQEMNVERPLSLSYFIGLGFDKADMIGVEDFYLTLKGKVMAAIFILGFPAMLAYKVHLKK
ncbi:MAG TPA: hypothetical protein EYG86_08900 [Crocinitomicaceae bacterium]|nr:hypothetical protein [Crocinitomicaceae bacterium]